MASSKWQNILAAGQAGQMAGGALGGIGEGIFRGFNRGMTPDQLIAQRMQQEELAQRQAFAEAQQARQQDFMTQRQNEAVRNDLLMRAAMGEPIGIVPSDLMASRKAAVEAGGMTMPQTFNIAGVDIDPSLSAQKKREQKQQDLADSIAGIREYERAKGFNLNAGEQRFQFNPETQKYEPIASALPKGVAPKIHSLSPGQTLVGEDGKVIYTAPSDQKDSRPIEVSPGATVIDKNGKVIFKNDQPSKEPSQSDKDFLTNVNTFKTTIDKLEDTVKKYGNYEMWNTDARAKLGALPYQLAIQYAKIVDPTSVAREGEVAAAQKYLIPLTTAGGSGPWGILPTMTRNQVTLDAIKNMRETVEEYQKNRATASGNQIFKNEEKKSEPSSVKKSVDDLYK